MKQKLTEYIPFRAEKGTRKKLEILRDQLHLRHVSDVIRIAIAEKYEREFKGNNK